MRFLGMSIPTLPGGLKKPPSRHPGARNIAREAERESRDVHEISHEKPDLKSALVPASTPPLPEIKPPEKIMEK